MDIEENLDNWRMWCRLCAKADSKRNMSLFFKDEQEEEFYICDENLEQSKSSLATKDTTLLLAIERHFSVHMLDNEDLPKVLCVDCLSLMRELTNFSERVAKVQKMFGTLQHATSTDLDLHAVRLEVDILDRDSEHLSMIKQSLSEVQFFKTNPQIAELEDQILDMETCNINPIEVQEMEIKIENAYKATADCLPNSDEDDIGVDDDEFLPTKDKLENAHISSDENNDNKTSAEEKRTTRTKNDSNDNDADDDDGESGEKLLTWTECPLQFKRIKRHQHHLKILPAKEPEFTVFSCSQCSLTFTNPYTLKKHMRMHLPLETRKIIACPYCEKKYTLNSHLKQHVKNTHLNERDFICEECGAALCTNESLQRHLLMHTGERPFKCKLCPRAFTDKRNLNAHMEIHDPSKHACPECGIQLSSLRSLKQHLIRHVGERSFQCEICEYKSYTKSEMTVHRRTHSGERPFPCNYCDKRFTNKNKMKRHARIHEKVRPYACTYCDKTFTESYNLKNHVISHTGISRFNCDTCRKVFQSNALLVKHYKSVGHLQNLSIQNESNENK